MPVAPRRPKPFDPPTSPTTGPGSAARALNDTAGAALGAMQAPGARSFSDSLGSDINALRGAIPNGNFQTPAPPSRPGLSTGAGLNRLFTGVSGPPPMGPYPPKAGITPRPDFPQLGQPHPEGTYNAPSGATMIPGPAAPVPVPFSAQESPVQNFEFNRPFAAPPSGVPFGPPLPPGGLHQPTLSTMGINPPAPPVAPSAPLSQTLEALLSGQKPVTGPSGASNASAAYAANGRPMTNEESQANYKASPADSKYQPNMTVGGNFGGPNASTYAAGDQVNKDIAKDKLNNASQPLNVAIANGMLQGRGKPQKDHDFGLGTPFSDLGNKYTKNDKGQMVRGPGFSGSDEAKAADAEKKLASPERKQYLDDRKATLAQRAEERAPGVQFNAQRRKDTRNANLGRATAGERIAFADPKSNAYRDVGMAQANAAGQANQARTETDRMRIAAGERSASGRDAAHIEASKNMAIGRAAANDKPNPFDPKADSGKPLSEPDIRLLPKEQQMEELSKIHGPAAANEMMNQWHGTQGHNYVQQPTGPSANILQHIAAPFGLTPNATAQVSAGQAPPASQSPPAQNTAKMGGGMGLPPAPKPKPGSRTRYGAYEH